MELQTHHIKELAEKGKTTIHRTDGGTEKIKVVGTTKEVLEGCML